MEQLRSQFDAGMFMREVSYGSRADRPYSYVSAVECFKPTRSELRRLLDRIVVDTNSSPATVANAQRTPFVRTHPPIDIMYADDDKDDSDSSDGPTDDNDDLTVSVTETATTVTMSRSHMGSPGDRKLGMSKSTRPSEYAKCVRIVMYKVRDAIVHDISGMIEGTSSYYSNYSRYLRRYAESGSDADLKMLRSSMLRNARTRSGLIRNGINKFRVCGFCRSVISVSYSRFERTVTIPEHIASQTMVPVIVNGRWGCRSVKSGDWCILIRNPTLDQRATQPWIVKVVDNSETNPYSIKLPSSQTVNMAADYDGDTCTAWFLSDDQSIGEASSWKMDIESIGTPANMTDLMDRKSRWTRGPHGCYRLTTLCHDDIMNCNLSDIDEHRTFRHMGLRSSHIDNYRRVTNNRNTAMDMVNGCNDVLMNSMIKSKAKSTIGHVSRMGKTIASMFFDVCPGVVYSLIGDGVNIYVDPFNITPLRRGSRHIRVMSSLLRGSMQTALKSKMMGGFHDHDPMSDMLLGNQTHTIIMTKAGVPSMISTESLKAMNLSDITRCVLGSYSPAVISRLSGKHKYRVCLIGAKLIKCVTRCKCSRSELEALVSMMLTICSHDGLLRKAHKATLGTWFEWSIHYYSAPAKSDKQFLSAGSMLFNIMFPGSMTQYNSSPLILTHPGYGQRRYHKDLGLH